MLSQIATPPSLETGILCIFLSPGSSISPCFSEKEITKGTMNTPNKKEIIAPIICASDNLIIMFLLLLDLLPRHAEFISASHGRSLMRP